MKFLYADSTNPVFVFERKLDDRIIVVTFNLSELPQIINQKLELKNVEYKELLSEESGKIISADNNAEMVININPKSFKIFKLKAAD